MLILLEAYHIIMIVVVVVVDDPWGDMFLLNTTDDTTKTHCFTPRTLRQSAQRLAGELLISG